MSIFENGTLFLVNGSVFREWEVFVKMRVCFIKMGVYCMKMGVCFMKMGVRFRKWEFVL